MVFFTCNDCRKSLKKNQVAKHKCQSQSNSCFDRQVSSTHIYQQHVKCLTENQKYGSKNHAETEAKGGVKESAWSEQVQHAIECITEPKLKNLLQNIQGRSNIPRKEEKFINFLTNSCHIRDVQLCKMAWAAISNEALKQKNEEVNEANEKLDNNDHSSDTVKKKEAAQSSNSEGELKRSAWCEHVQHAIECVNEPRLKNLLQNIQGRSNIPRKEAKFINFLTKSYHIRDVQLCKMAWDAISNEALKQKKEEVKEANEKLDNNDHSSDTVKKKEAAQSSNSEGELKRSAWCEHVQHAIECVNEPRLKNLLQNIQGRSNIPRKEAKFINFLTKSYHIRDVQLCKMAWDAISNEALKQKKEEVKEANEKGELKRSAWCEQVQHAIECVTEPQLKNLLQNIQGCSNIPRKEAKFINFLTKSYHIRDVQLCKMAWDAISNEALKQKKEEVKEANEKGELKRSAWCEQVQHAIECVTEPQLKNLLQNIQGCSNIPRKEAKFINFLTNSFRIRDVQLCKTAWAAISNETLKQKKEEVEEANEKPSLQKLSLNNNDQSSDTVKKNGVTQSSNNKGDLTQIAWCEQVQHGIECVKEPRLKNLLKNIQGRMNIPRKEAKFINFLTNSSRIGDVQLCKMAWAAISNEALKQKKEEVKEANEKLDNNDHSSDTVKKEEAAQSSNSEDSLISVGFKWKATIKRKLREAGGEMKMKRLRSEVLDAYKEVVGVKQELEDVQALFEARLAKSGVTVNGNLVSLS